MDIGTAFGGMGASREMMISALAEPAMLMAVFTLAMTAHTTNLSSGHRIPSWQTGLVLRPSFCSRCGGLVLVAVAETGRIPVDNPATHLELTMIHEAMILEYSGRHLALIEWAAQIKLMLYGVLIVNIFFPGASRSDFSAAGAGHRASSRCRPSWCCSGWCSRVARRCWPRCGCSARRQFLSLAFMLSLLGDAEPCDPGGRG